MFHHAKGDLIIWIYITFNVNGVCGIFRATGNFALMGILNSATTISAQSISLQWRHNEPNGVWNHPRLDCLLNGLFRFRSKKTSKLRVIGLCEGNPSLTSGLPYKGPVTRQMIPFGDVKTLSQLTATHVKISYGDVIKWKHFSRNCPFVRGIHLPLVNSPHKGKWRGALMFSLIYA